MFCQAISRFSSVVEAQYFHMRPQGIRTNVEVVFAVSNTFIKTWDNIPAYILQGYEDHKRWNWLNENKLICWFVRRVSSCHNWPNRNQYKLNHGLRTPKEERAVTARPKIQSESQIFRYGWSIFCLPHQPNFLDIFDLCLHRVSIVRAPNKWTLLTDFDLEPELAFALSKSRFTIHPWLLEYLF